MVDFNDFEECSGIYCIENLVDHKKYVGKATNLRKRIRKHTYCLTRDEFTDEYNEYLWNSVKKYGINNFVVYVLEYCGERELNERETYHITTLHSHVDEWGYNHTTGGEGIPGYKWTPEQREKIRGRWEGAGNPMFGKDMNGDGNPAFGKKHPNSSSKYFGVSLAKKGKYQYWACDLQINKEPIHIGSYQTEEDAARSYDKYVLENNLPNPLNFPDEIEETLSMVIETPGRDLPRKKKREGTSSQYFGVTFTTTNGSRKCWLATVWENSKTYRIGSFETETDAARAYDRYVIENNLPNPLNFPEEYQ